MILRTEYIIINNATIHSIGNPAVSNMKIHRLSVPASQQVWLFPMKEFYDKIITRRLLVCKLDYIMLRITLEDRKGLLHLNREENETAKY